MNSPLIASGLLVAGLLTGCVGDSIAPEARGQSSLFDSFSFRRIGDEGGTSLYVRGNGTAWCQKVTLDERDNRIEQRYTLNLNQREMDQLSALLNMYDLFHLKLDDGQGSGRGPTTAIQVTGRAKRNELEGNDRTPHGGFQALRIQLQEFTQEVTRRRIPVRSGRLEDDWRPRGF